MRNLFPRSLAGQTILVLLIGLTVSHALSMLIYSGDRIEAITHLGGRHMAQRIGNIVRLLNETPPSWRSRVAAALDHPAFRVTLSRESQVLPTGEGGFRAALVRNFIEQELGGKSAPAVLVQYLEDRRAPALGTVSGTAGQMAGQMGAHMPMMMAGDMSAIAFMISVQLGDKSWVKIFSNIPDTGSFWSLTSLTSISLMVVAVILLSIWVVRRMTQPFRRFAAAAQILGKNIHAPPLNLEGPSEVTDAAKAFNDMQERLQRFVENRTRMLAAISHDLRTPITRLRLRAELAEDGEDRAKILTTLDEMEAMIASTMSFARDDADTEPARIVDLTALLESISDDFTDMGKNVELTAQAGILYECRPNAIKRALTNLIENAVNYGGNARIRLDTEGTGLVIIIDDDGPGIPPDRLDRVFDPFFRLEESRSAATGGIGLGLSVVQTIINAHGGEISIINRQDCGLRAVVKLPN
ncbi:MAG: HAMP domain-containing protein [Rhodospirillaceae bacterium]|jgi:signal transduction histidine kinase|nr:HAMP domain-containing protein [Rhodospirillaceae bacterium]MBT5456949.1 HAMP domain-containing protein [Rhodospirillaceae bacterium]